MIEFANARLIQKPNGWYIHVTCYVPKQEHKHNYKTVGVDFGCETSFTTYVEETNESRKLNYCFEQSENEKRVKRKLSRRISRKFSNKTNKGLRLSKKLRKQKQKQSNQKKDATNKLIFWFKQFETVVIQDEMLSNWQKYGHDKKIEKGILGRVKANLKNIPNLFWIEHYQHRNTVSIVSIKMKISKYVNENSCVLIVVASRIVIYTPHRI